MEAFEEKVNQGIKFINEDNYPKALQLLGEAYIMRPYDKVLLDLIAFLWQRVIDGNIDLIPETCEQYVMRGAARIQKQQFGEAFKDFDKAISINPKNDYAFKCRGFVWALQGNHNEAIKDYFKAIDLNPNRGEYWDDTATSYEAVGNVEQAYLFHESAVKKSPDDARLWYNYGVFLIDYFQDLDGALDKLNKALEIFPGYEDAQVNRDHLLTIKNSRN